ncbi:AAEL002696-PA [Aedes aegypti]|uniref:AAEL002696-PA n=1 Tax=Aedes aegypti TaxID=7159 RepID=Q17HF5_AEDAE|nr:AAEL002696-PA [Aedes aegypti]
MLSPVLVLISLFVIILGSSSASDVVPKEYIIQFETDILDGDGKYNGTVWIDFDALKGVDQLDLQASNLGIEEVYLSNDKADFSMQRNGYLLIKLKDQIPKGSYQLKITFNGTTSDHDDVMFRGAYKKGVDGSIGFYLMSKPTKPESNEAPCAFPHFGKDFRTTFRISVTHSEGLKAWSNMPLENAPKPHDHDNYVISSFQQTPKMHVYDVGFFVADFDSLKIGNLTVVAREGIRLSSQYVASLGNNLVRIMDEYTAVDYNESTPDYVHIALPRELGIRNLTEFERMFVEEQYMIYDKEKDDLDKLSKVLQYSSYKLMLQWLGNFIAPEEERLHQAFSNIYTYFNAEKVYPEEFMMLLYQMNVLQGSLWNYHEMPSSVLNMFWLIAFDDKWRIVMRNLMKNRTPRTLTTAQLCSEIQTLWHEDYNLPEGTALETIFNQWMYSDEAPPILNVHRLYSEGKAILSQNGSEKILPYNYATEYSHFNQLGPFQWITRRNETVHLGASDDHWLIVNKEEFGFYRVNYDERNWQLISQALRSNASGIHRMNRMQLLDDALYFAKNDQLDVTILLELITYLRGETFYVAWYNAYNVLASGYFYEIEPPKHIKTFFLHLIEPYYRSFASQEISSRTPRMELYIQSRIAGLACWLGKEDCLRQARCRFQQAVAQNSSIEPNWTRTIYCYGLQNASDEELEWVLKKHATDFSHSVEYLGCVGNKKHLRRVLEELVKSNNSQILINFIRELHETRWEILHSLLTTDEELIGILDLSTIKTALQHVSRDTRSKKTLVLIDDLEKALVLEMENKGSGSTDKNIWAHPKVAEFIEHYMNGLED